ncbi:MAG: hypothetical protein D6718_01980 [Acidobacteria bacterium]|nr:MAG: hypothetical protein D6718_01980 [Acidobacteriota bacterium]
MQPVANQTIPASEPALDPKVYRRVEPENLFVTEPPELGRDDFLRLLVTQLENQNPLEPMEDTQFVAQLANFSSLEQLMDLNTRMDSVLEGQSQLVNSQALNLIGRDVLVDSGGELDLSPAGADRLAFDLVDAASSVRVEIYDASGDLVRTIEMDALEPGRHTVDWDGLDESGRELPSGTYRFRVAAKSADGTERSLHGFLMLPVEGIHVGEGGLSLVSGLRVIPFDKILEIRRPDVPAGA